MSVAAESAGVKAGVAAKPPVLLRARSVGHPASLWPGPLPLKSRRDKNRPAASAGRGDLAKQNRQQNKPEVTSQRSEGTVRFSLWMYAGRLVASFVLLASDDFVF